ncbi:uncharacterized protein FIBRA_01557 [Fibroporia radiculosa]|uniref:RNA cytidine acetyltransferase n=1 Tax=Fibroporia radiculosa TaxID=599839 RepID=J4H195_9APHY|nr:uncharacterized protein FIBRA_01557 [Fibroporia radiculosa]CCL99539.1 predicted protein [Fibroporia radiculosa]
MRDASRPVPPKLPPRQRVSEPAVAAQPSLCMPAPDELDVSVPAPGAFEPPSSLEDDPEENLTQVQLRKLLEDEEIDRFLHLFSAYVREARVSNFSQQASSVQTEEQLPCSGADVLEAEETGDWVPLKQSATTPSETPPPYTPSQSTKERSISEQIALDYVVPRLPPASPPPPSFTLQRLQLAVQRNFLAFNSMDSPMVMHLIQLATWQDTQTSRYYCFAYWFLWYHNFLLPSLILRLLYSLIYHKLHPFPTLGEIRNHRREVARADELSVALTSRLAASPTYDVQDVWKLFKEMNRTRKQKKVAKSKMQGIVPMAAASEVDTQEAQVEVEDLPLAQDVDPKQLVLSTLNHLADLHERVKNIFLWRKPSASLLCGMILFATFFFTLLPAKYLVKICGFAFGMCFWHVVPIVAAIPPEDRARMPIPLHDVPTDADYAMELISQRVALGLDIKPRRSSKDDNQFGDSEISSLRGEESQGSSQAGSSSAVDWKKWGNRVAATKSHTGNVKKMFQDGQWKRPENWMALNPLAPKEALPRDTTPLRVQTYTFPAQYAKSSGLITLTSDTFHFTSLLSSSAKLSIPLADVRSVKKTGPMRGLNVQWARAGLNGQMEEREEKFFWEGALARSFFLRAPVCTALLFIPRTLHLPQVTPIEMFFTPELLEKRESGFGLLWLAATLGAKSSFKKLPKRSVLTADIAQLCGLIAEPAEPLALRLSSNLMIGVARVYKGVKQEIFLTDVTTCFTSLKKVVHEMHSSTEGSAGLQMGQPSLRPDILTIVEDPGTAFALNFDAMFGDWDDGAQDRGNSDAEESDDEFDPITKKGKHKAKGKAKAKTRPPSSALSENPRVNLHTLEENYEHLFSGSFDASFNGSGLGGIVVSSGNTEGGFGFGNDLFDLPEGIDFSREIGDELARELGEGWGASPDKGKNGMDVDPFMDPADGALEMDFQFENLDNGGLLNHVADNVSQRREIQTYDARDSSQDDMVVVQLSPLGPNQDVSDDLQLGASNNEAPTAPTQKKAKRVRLLLDARTELTDEELKAARENYLEGQDTLRRNIAQKRIEKESGKLIEDILWGVPRGLDAPILADFWTENFKVQVEAQAGTLHIESQEPPAKRRRLNEQDRDEDYVNKVEVRLNEQNNNNVDTGFMIDDLNDMDHPEGVQEGPTWDLDSRMRSSEEPGQARHISRPPSLFGGQLEIGGPGPDFLSGSQKSALFPWDNAGISSSVNGASLDFGSMRQSFTRADTALRGSSVSSRRESSLQPGRLQGSPLDFGVRHSQIPGEDPAAFDSQQSDLNIMALERHSFNFLEYAKMQLQTFPSATSTLTFDDVVPKVTSTPHVAAAAFYHCLVCKRLVLEPMRKQLDPRLPILINNNVKKNHRSFIVLVGDKGRDQIVNLHFLLSQARVSARPSVLWCYKKELGFTSHRKKREAKIKRDVKRGIREPNEQDPFEIFITVTDIRYTFYKESHKILGQTYGMCVLQDFEAITPNLLARTIETVEGGGLVVILLKTMASLRQLYTMTMDVHARYRTSAHDTVVARFNERFILSLGSCEDCLVLDDELNVLPLSRGKDIVPLEEERGKGKAESELNDLKDSLADTKPIGDLVKLAKTIDQGQAILTFVDAIAEKTLSSTVALTAARGRGKSAALGLAIAAALSHGYSNIFVTSPSPENLKTLFEFIFKGMDVLGYEEHLDYDIAQSTNPDFNKAIVRVNVFRQHRQTIQYIQPQDAHVLGQAELVIIDEAAAIPLPLVRNLLGPYLVFMASTINGYEGTGRSLSLKLIQQLRENTRPSLTKDAAPEEDGTTAASSSSKKVLAKAPPKARSLREIKLETPIRYAPDDKVEKWLNGLLCLDATLTPSQGVHSTPHPSQCELFYVSRDTLFSYHPASEVFLQRMMALYVASHYKNQPNDLQLLSDAPAHHLFVLLPPIKDDESRLPEPLVVLQVALEGNISRQAILDGLSRGFRAGGDMIPWLVAQQFQENRFAQLSGARIVRIATHPDYANMGYGARALQALNSFYSGEYFNLDEVSQPELSYPDPAVIDDATTLLTDIPTIRSATAMPPLLRRLTERKPEMLDYLGVSYGLTPQLLRFWKRAGYVPLYVRQTTSELTGEHTCVMVRGLNTSTDEELQWLGEFAKDFRRRFLSLLSFKFREFGSVTALSILEAANNGAKRLAQDSAKELYNTELSMLLSPFDLKRLESYANNTLDYHVVLDLLPTVAALYFEKRLGDDVHLSAVQSSILLALGLQRKTIEEVEAELQVPVSQALALFAKVIKKISKRLLDVQRAAVSAEIADASTATAAATRVDGGVGATNWKPVETSLEAELKDAGDEATRALREKQREMIGSLDLSKYAIDDGSVADWSAAEAQVARLASGGGGKSTVVSVKATGAVTSQKRKAEEGEGGDKVNEGKRRHVDKEKEKKGARRTMKKAKR